MNKTLISSVSTADDKEWWDDEFYLFTESYMDGCTDFTDSLVEKLMSVVRIDTYESWGSFEHMGIDDQGELVAAIFTGKAVITQDGSTRQSHLNG